MMQTLDYLVIYRDDNSIYTDITKTVPISIVIKEEANAEEKLDAIRHKVSKRQGIDYDFKIIGIFKL